MRNVIVYWVTLILIVLATMKVAADNSDSNGDSNSRKSFKSSSIHGVAC